jgi:hypothetical protein
MRIRRPIIAPVVLAFAALGSGITVPALALTATAPAAAVIAASPTPGIISFHA